MKRIEKGNYIILEDEKDDVKNFASFLIKYYNSFQNENVVVNILKYGQLSLEELLSFLKLSDKHRKAKKSFVIVNDTINIDPVPEEMIVVPTLREAEDVIQMEDIERDLGF
ncbi:MAG TPA: ribonuclease Z [Flavobacteriaceae bacterium]|nr:ribonuclease Z [Flavobacteriaceae bacterium]